jgi:hypothetical protein
MENDFFKISNPRENLSHVSSWVELRRDEHYGRMLVASRKLLPGDIIAIEEPFFKSLDKSSDQLRCAKCLRIIIDAVLCKHCGAIKFCSFKCRDEAWISFHKFECKYFKTVDQDDAFFLLTTRMLFKSISVCGSVEKLMKHVECIDESVTVFDKRNGTDDDLFYLSCCFNLECGNVHEDFKFANSCLSSSIMKSLCTSIDQRDMLKKLMLKILGILNRNSFLLKMKDGATVGALFAFTSLINHSCNPNIEKIKMGNKIALVCRLPVEKNQQLLLCYRQVYFTRMRLL